MIELQQATLRSLVVQPVERALGANITADQVTREQGTIYLRGNVIISFADGVVVTADDAAVEKNREIRLGGNARVTAPQK